MRVSSLASASLRLLFLRHESINGALELGIGERDGGGR